MTATRVGSVPGGRPDVDEVRWARAGLLRVCEPPAEQMWEFVERVGPVAAWSAVRSGRAPTGVAGEVKARTENVAAAELDWLIEADLAAAAQVDARLVIPEDPEWPTAAIHPFRTAAALGATGSTGPLALWVRGGSLTDLPDRAVSIVGSRACTSYGQRVAADLALGLADEEVTVVSGAAFGIDTAAHRAALAAASDRPTVAVLACGIDRAYPVANRRLIEMIAARGCVVSEYPPGANPARHRFLVRNRLIAAFGRGTVVVEAGRRSGALSTASAARLLNRSVLAVPGPVTSASSVGCHHLISAQGSSLVTSVADVIAVLWPAGLNQSTLFGSAAAETTDSGEAWDADTARVLDALPSRAPRTIAELARDSGVPATSVLAALTVMELQGQVRHTANGWHRRNSPSNN